MPSSYSPFFGSTFRRLRSWCCSHIFQECGKNVNIERKAYFGTGKGVIIGDNSGIGIKCITFQYYYRKKCYDGSRMLFTLI